MYMTRNKTAATFSIAGKDQRRVASTSRIPLALGTSLMMRNTRNTRRSGRALVSTGAAYSMMTPCQEEDGMSTPCVMSYESLTLK